MPPLLDFLRTRDLPRFARRNYVFELQSTYAWGVCAGVIEGNTSSIVVDKTFGGSDFLVSVVWSTPMLANILSVFFGAAARGRPKLRMSLLLSLLTVASMLSIALTPLSSGPWGGWVFALQIGLARTFLAGVVTLRAGIWEANYPATHRGRITGRIQKLRAAMSLLAAAAVTSLFDSHSEYYQVVYPAAGLVGLLSLGFFRRIRVRGERRDLALYARLASSDAPAHRGLWAPLRDAAQVLRDDPRFARYCRAQYFLGSANFMMDPIVLYFVTRRMNLSYFLCSAVLDIVPSIVMLAAMNFVAAQYDRVGLPRFRVSNSTLWLVSIAGSSLAILLVEFGGSPGVWLGMSLLFASRIVTGIGRAGGAIAWNIGHLHYAQPHLSDLYMGIHQFLTGIRGLIMPFIGRFAYRYFGSLALLVAVALAAAAVFLFRNLARDDELRPARPVRATSPPAHP